MFKNWLQMWALAFSMRFKVDTLKMTDPQGLEHIMKKHRLALWVPLSFISLFATFACVIAGFGCIASCADPAHVSRAESLPIIGIGGFALFWMWLMVMSACRVGNALVDILRLKAASLFTYVPAGDKLVRQKHSITVTDLRTGEIKMY